jgi:hypothetical protein
MDLDRTLLIVTGAHLEAETHDRPVAYTLRDRMLAGLSERGQAKGQVIVCSDLWYLNNEALRHRPTVSVGAPALNALTAFLGDKLPSVFTVDGVLVVQADLEMLDLVVCCWGRDHASTEAAVKAFGERYLDQYLDAVAASL